MGQLPDDAVLRPSIEQAAREHTPIDPWNPSSMGYVAFFGGVVPSWYIAVANAKRHRLDAAAVRRIHLVHAAMLVVATAIIAVRMDSFDAGIIRSATRGAGVVAFLLTRPLFRGSRRRFQAAGGEWTSMWRQGLLATFGIGLLANLAVTVVLAALGALGVLDVLLP